MVRRHSTTSVGFVAAVLLLVLPTFFGVLPEWTRWHIGVRGALLVAWVAVAAASTWLALQRDAHLNRLVSSGSAQREWRRVLAFETILSATLRPGTRGIPEHYEFTLYVFDPRDAVLAPVWPTLSDHERSLISFPAGAGATGTAWSRRSTMSVTGTAVANGQYGLSEAQQRHFRAYRSVAAEQAPMSGPGAMRVLVGIGWSRPWRTRWG
jgi:hypothetical protein